MPESAIIQPLLIAAVLLSFTSPLWSEQTVGQPQELGLPVEDTHQGLTLQLQPFISDGCSMFPNGTLEDHKLWLTCCQKHDYDYWKGGTEAERQASDQALRQCVVAVGEPRIAQLMLTGVRLGGSPYLPTQFRWGYGWRYLRGYKALSLEEQAQVDKLSWAIEW